MKRPHSSEEDESEQKRGRTETFDDDESERLAEENLKKLQSLAERASASQKTPEKKSQTGSSSCAKSHWKKIGHLILYTAAGVRGSSKVRHTHGECVFQLSLKFTSGKLSNDM